ncbi:MAG: MFS transporter [Candidatus Helarchaeota archaeon]|nr:MFS transporter [Candidatus Helarchaeota archaeon]
MVKDYERSRAETFSALLLIYTGLFLCKNILPANITNIKTAFAITGSAIAMIIGINLIVLIGSILIFGYFGERLSQKYSIKKIFALTQFGWVICFGLVAISANFFQYSLFYILSACFEGAYLPIAFAMVSDFYSPEERGTKFGWLNTFLLLGSGGGIVFGTLLGQAIPVIGWRIAYGLAFVLAFLAISGYVIRGIIPIRGKHETEFEGLGDAVDYDYKITFKNIKKIFRSKSVGALLISVLLGSIATSTIGYWGLYYFETSQLVNFGASAALVALLFPTLAGLGGLPGNIHGGKIGDRHYNSGNLRGRVTISLFGIVVGLACLFGFYLIPVFSTEPLGMVLLSILVLGLGFVGYWFVSFPVGNGFAIYSEVCLPEIRSSTNALHGVMANIGGVIGNFLLGSMIAIEAGEKVTPFHMSILLIFWLAGGLMWIIPYFTYPGEAKECRNVMLERRAEIKRRGAN